MSIEGEVVRTRLWRDGVVALDDFPLADLSEHRLDPTALLWVDLCRPGAAMMERLSEELGLNAHEREDAIAPGERPRATRRGGQMFVTVYDTDFSRPDADELEAMDSRLRRSRVSIFVLPDGIVTIRPDDGVDMQAVIERWEQEGDLLRFGSAALLHGLLDVIVDGHQAVADRFDDRVEDLEDMLFAQNSDTRKVQELNYRVRKELVEFRRVVTPMREVLTAIMRYRIESGRLPELDASYEDLNDHVVHVGESTESLREIIASIFETNLALQDARLNTVMKKLTGWAAIIAVPTAITGWYGQNVPYPGSDQVWGLIMSAATIFVLAVGLFVLFRRKDWI